MVSAEGGEYPRRHDFDPWLIINSVRRRLPIFGAVVIVCLLLAFGLTSLQKPMYSTQVSILIDPRHKEVVTTASDPGTAPLASMDVDTEVAVLESTGMARSVAEKLNLKALPEFKDLDVPIEQVLPARISAARAGATYVINLTAEDRNPKVAAEIAQGYAQAYIDKQMQDKAAANDTSLNWLNGRLASIRAQTQADDQNLQAYKVAHNLMSAEGATMAEQEISSLNQSMANSKADLDEKRARLAAATQPGNADVAESLSTDLVRQLRKQRTDVAADLAKLQANYGPKYPEVVKDQSQIAQIDAQIGAENKRALASLSTDVKVAQQRYDSLIGSHANSTAALRSNNVAEVGLMELQRRADASHAIYDTFLARARELTAQAGLQQPGASIIADAKVPTSPSSPNLRVNLAAGLLLGLMIGGAYVLVSELLDHTYKTGREVAESLGLKNLASIPYIDMRGVKNKNAKLTYVLDKPYSLFSEAIRSLRMQIGLASRKEPVKVISITSALPGEGKTLTCLSLARAMAANGSRVLLIDADLRRLSLTKYLNASPTYGIQDVFEKPSLMSQSILVDDVSGADMMLVPRSRAVATEVFTNSLFEKMIDRLKQSYDYIILDTPPVLALSDIRVISAVTDAMLLVVRWNKTPKDAVQLATRILEESEAKVMGVCLNQINMKSAVAQGYGDAIHYFNDFKEYWSDKESQTA